MSDNSEMKNETVVNEEVKETAKAAEGDVKNDPSKTEATPGEYKDFTLPEGFTIDEDTMKVFKELAKEDKLSQDKAQKYIDVHAKLAQKLYDNQVEAWRTMQKEWRTKSQEDKEIGGTEFNSNVSLAKKALEKFGTKEFKEVIETTGMGNHPELIRFLYRVGKTISEDKLTNDGKVSDSNSKDYAKILFPNMN
jgi:hypothetical protein